MSLFRARKQKKEPPPGDSFESRRARRGGSSFLQLTRRSPISFSFQYFFCS